jgi:bifunctional non-homologous end joining protein LigD
MSAAPPNRIAPMLARETSSLPDGPGWAFEIKWDGVRALAHDDGSRVRIRSRRGEEITDRYPELAGLHGALAGRSAILDGEIVALDPSGRPSFQLLQRRMGVTSPLTIRRRVPETPVTFVAFDLLALDGEPAADLPYERRRELLAGLALAGPHWQAPRHHVGDGGALLEAARRQRLEGVVAKRLTSPYRPGRRSEDWVKVRIKQRQDFVIGGWMRGDGGRSRRLGSLLLGVWDRSPTEADAAGEPQRLVYAGGVGSGLSERAIDQLGELLEPLRSEVSPFELGVGPKRPNPVFCEPRLVCAVEFSEWTREHTLRQPAYKGLRDDVEAAEVVREMAP